MPVVPTRRSGTACRDLAGNGRVLPRSPPVQVFVRLEESTVAHCPSLSPVSAPFLRNARHFLPFLSLSTLPHLRCPLLPFSLTLFSLYVCTLAVCSLFRSFGSRKYHLPPPPPTLSSKHRRSFIRETDGPEKIFETLARLEISRHPYVCVYA